MMVEKLKSWEYYYKKLPLYMRNSYGIPEHFKMIFDLLTTTCDVEDEICDLFEVLDDDYVENIIEKYSTKDGYDFDFLDELGLLFGITRSLNVSYVDNITQETVTKNLYLTNYEMWLFIKARVIQNNYDGSYEQSREYYEKIGLPIYMLTSNSDAAHCYLYLSETTDITENIQYLFLSGHLTLESVGITYSTYVVNLETIGIWAGPEDEPTSNNTWDLSNWA